MSQNNDSAKTGIYAVVTLKAEILVDVPNGSKAELAAREYLSTHPEALKMILLSCEGTKIRRLKKEQGGAYPLGGRS